MEITRKIYGCKIIRNKQYNKIINQPMSHEIEYNFTEEYWNDEKQCRHCDSLGEKEGKGFCRELEIEVPLAGHCDFFRSRD